jgi:hypothetical protein
MKTKLLLIAFLLLSGMAAQAQDQQVMRAELPSVVRKFLKNFRSPFNHAVKQTSDKTVWYNIVLNDETKIQFTHDGVWRSIDGKGKPVKCKFLKKEITDYVGVNYPTESITKVESAKSQYKLYLTNGTVLKFDQNGTPLKKA